MEDGCLGCLGAAFVTNQPLEREPPPLLVIPAGNQAMHLSHCVYSGN